MLPAELYNLFPKSLVNEKEPRVLPKNLGSLQKRLGSFKDPRLFRVFRQKTLAIYLGSFIFQDPGKTLNSLGSFEDPKDPRLFRVKDPGLSKEPRL